MNFAIRTLSLFYSISLVQSCGPPIAIENYPIQDYQYQQDPRFNDNVYCYQYAQQYRYYCSRIPAAPGNPFSGTLVESCRIYARRCQALLVAPVAQAAPSALGSVPQAAPSALGSVPQVQNAASPVLVNAAAQAVQFDAAALDPLSLTGRSAARVYQEYPEWQLAGLDVQSRQALVDCIGKCPNRQCDMQCDCVFRQPMMLSFCNQADLPSVSQPNCDRWFAQCKVLLEGAKSK